MTARIRVGGLFVGLFDHASNFDDRRIQVTKMEMDCILKGYPPWYQDPLSLSNGHSVPHPIQDGSDVYRGGWIVAVGLSSTRPTALAFMETRKMDGLRNYVAVGRAFDRVLHSMTNLGKSFREPRVRIAQELVLSAYASERMAPSAFRDLFRRSLLTEDFGPGWFECTDFAQNLTNDQSKLIMQVFNQYEELSDDQIQGLDGILKTALRAALVGTYKVVTTILYDRTTHFRMLPELMQDRHIYVFERRDDYEN
jgi:hypothetical protein